MKLSTRGRYGVAAMYELALHYGEGTVSLKTIAANQEISEHYLEQLMSILRNAGYVVSTRGAQGGYRLAHEPDKITVGDVITTMEGPIEIVECLSNNSDSQRCKKAAVCSRRNVWQKVCTNINDVLQAISLADLCQEEQMRG